MYIAICTYKNQTFVRETSILDRKGMIEEVSGGHIEDIVQIINVDLAKGTSADVTADIAEDVFRQLDAMNEAPHHALEVWLNTFGHDCSHLF